MKKLLAIFPLCLLLSGLVFPRSEVKATEFVLPNTYEALPYVDLITALQSGATFDLTGDISSVEEFLEKNALKKVSGTTSDFSNSIIQTSDRLFNEIQNEYMRRTIDNDFTEFLIPWHKSDFATNIGYDVKWYQRYEAQVNTGVTALLPSEYSWFSQINNIYCYGQPLSLINNTHYPDVSNYTLLGDFTYDSDKHLSNNGYLYAYAMTPKLTVNVIYDSNSNLYNLTYSSFQYCLLNNPNDLSPNQGYMNRFEIFNNELYIAGYSAARTPILYSFDSLDSCINYLYKSFWNIDLYVNGDAWILTNQEPDSVNFPDVIGTNYDDLAYDVVVPTDNNLAFDICKLYGWLYDNITQGLDNYLTWDDLISGGIIVDTDTGEAITDADADTRTKTEPVSKVVDDTLVGEADGGNLTPTPDPERIFPILPIDVSPIDNALGGSTILAEIVDATQNALPSELIDAFWGIVFILFIIGIIWTFHK